MSRDELVEKMRQAWCETEPPMQGDHEYYWRTRMAAALSVAVEEMLGDATEREKMVPTQQAIASRRSHYLKPGSAKHEELRKLGQLTYDRLREAGIKLHPDTLFESIGKAVRAAQEQSNGN